MNMKEKAATSRRTPKKGKLAMSDDGRPADERPDSRRRFQFTIRTLLILTAVVSVVCAVTLRMDGLQRITGVLVLVSIVLGGYYVKRRAYSPLVFLCAGPIIATVWLGAGENLLPTAVHWLAFGVCCSILDVLRIDIQSR